MAGWRFRVSALRWTVGRHAVGEIAPSKVAGTEGREQKASHKAFGGLKGGKVGEGGGEQVAQAPGGQWRAQHGCLKI